MMENWGMKNEMKCQCCRPLFALWRLNWAGDSLGEWGEFFMKLAPEEYRTRDLLLWVQRATTRPRRSAWSMRNEIVKNKESSWNLGMSYSFKFEEQNVLCAYRVEKTERRVNNTFVNNFIIIKYPYLFTVNPYVASE